MKIVDRLLEQCRHLVTSPAAALIGWRRFARRNYDLVRFCFRRMGSENGPAMSAALSFDTLFALIPALVLAAVLLKPFGLVETTKVGLNDFLNALGVEQIVVRTDRTKAPGAAPAGDDESPHKVVLLSNQIEDLVGAIEHKITFGRVGFVSIFLLVWTVIALLTTLERSLDRIFGARRLRPLGRRMLIYCSVVTLCPLLLAAAVYLSGLGAAGLEGSSAAHALVRTVEWLTPLVVGVLVLALVYKLMPNTPVRFSGALVGALVAVPLFSLAKWGFGLYVEYAVVNGNIYGTLGLLPLFLLWVNLLWMIFLLGAVLAHTVACFGELVRAEGTERFIQSPSARVAAALALARPPEAGAGPVPLTEIASRLRLPATSVEILMDKLASLKVIHRIETPAVAYVLARPAARISISELLEMDTPGGARSDVEYDPEIASAVENFRGRAHGALSQWSLADFLAQSK